MNDWDESELTDEEKMMNLLEELEELQKENEELKQRLYNQPQPQSMEPLLQTIRQQEEKITQQNFSLSEERKQNEKLLELAKSEKMLNEENRNLQNQINELQNTLKLKNAQLQKLLKRVEDFDGKFNNLPSKTSIDDFGKSLGNAVHAMDSLRWYHVVNWGVVLVFAFVILFNGICWWKLKDTTKDTLTITTQTNNAIYNQEGYSVLSGSRASKDALAADQDSHR